MLFNLNSSSENKNDRLETIWSNILLIANVYNFVTFCFFIAFPAFPFSAWLVIEVLIELLLIWDTINRLIFQKCFKDVWERMLLLKNRNERGTIHRILYVISAIPTSIIIYVAVPHHYHSQVWIAVIRILKLLRISQIKQYFDVRDLRTKRNSYLRSS